MQVGRLDKQKRCRIGVVAPASRMSAPAIQPPNQAIATTRDTRSSIVPTKSESSMDGDRERHGLFRRDRPMRRPLCAGAHGAEPIERQCLAVVGSIHAGWPRASVTSAHADSII